MNKNIALRINETIFHKAKHMAFKQNQSLSQWVTQIITKTVLKDRSFKLAKRQALKQLEAGFHLGEKPISREKIYERNY